MNIVDIILALILLYGLIQGFFRGFLAEIASLVGIILGIYGAINFSYMVSDFLLEYVDWELQYVNLIAFAITFFLIVLVFSIIGRLLTKIINFAALGIFNRLLGAGFGFLKIAFFTSLLIMFFSSTNEEINLVEEKTLEASKLYEPVAVVAPTLLPSILREARERNILKNSEGEESNL